MKTAILALLIFHGVWAWGQTTYGTQHPTGTIPQSSAIPDFVIVSRPNTTESSLQVTAAGDTLLMECKTKETAQIDLTAIPDKKILHCDLIDGHTLDEVMQVMVDSLNHASDGYKEENEDLRARLDLAICLLKSLTNHPKKAMAAKTAKVPK